MVLRLDVLDTLKPLLSAFELLLPALNLGVEFRLVKSQLLDGIVHLGHLAGLGVNDVANALLDVRLLCVCIKIATD